jgi:hypothetical protein
MLLETCGKFAYDIRTLRKGVSLNDERIIFFSAYEWALCSGKRVLEVFAVKLGIRLWTSGSGKKLE